MCAEKSTPSLKGWNLRRDAQTEFSLWPRMHNSHRQQDIMDRKNITGRRIRQLRIEKGMTVYRLSRALPASAPLSCEEIAKIELGIRKVFDYEILAISEILGVPISDLFATPPRKRRAEKGPG